MTHFEKIIRVNYANADELIQLVRSIDLENVINIALKQIEAAIKSGDKQKLINISGIILTSVNSKIQTLINSGDKVKVEYLLADIFQDFLSQIPINEDNKSILYQIQDSLKTTCELNNYDFNSLVSLLNLEKHLILLPKHEKRGLYYFWNGKSEELDGLVREIYDKGWINSVKEFKRLFKPVTSDLMVHCNQNKMNEILLLFQVLKETHLIQPKGKGSSGHFSPLVQYSVDNDENFLFKKSPNRIHEIMKRNMSKYLMDKRFIEEIVKANTSTSLRHLVVNGH
jgi:hypothetical protein